MENFCNSVYISILYMCLISIGTMSTCYNLGSIGKINIDKANKTYDNTDDDQSCWEVELKPLPDVISMGENWPEDLDLLSDRP